MDTSVEILGLRLDNPLMTAAGPLTGKPQSVNQVAEQGLGAVVLKTVSTEAAQVPTPAITKLESGILNCELWSEVSPNKFVEDYCPQISASVDQPVIFSLGYTPDQLRELIPDFEPYADAYELSSHYLGEDPEPIANISRTASELTDKPVFIKLSPNVPDLKEFAQAAVEGGADGIVAINSLGPGLDIDLDTMSSPLGSEDGYGWLSGPPIRPIALHAVHTIHEAVEVPIIGTGGVSGAEDVLKFMAAGASGVQMLSYAISEGVGVYSDIVTELPETMNKYGFSNITDIIGRYSG